MICRVLFINLPAQVGNCYNTSFDNQLLTLRAGNNPLTLECSGVRSKLRGKHAVR